MGHGAGIAYAEPGASGQHASDAAGGTSTRSADDNDGRDDRRTVNVRETSDADRQDEPAFDSGDSAAAEDDEAADIAAAEDTAWRLRRGEDDFADEDFAEDDLADEDFADDDFGDEDFADEDLADQDFADQGTESDSIVAGSAARKEDADADNSWKVDAQEELWTADAAQTSYSAYETPADATPADETPAEVTPVAPVAESPDTAELAVDARRSSAAVDVVAVNVSAADDADPDAGADVHDVALDAPAVDDADEDADDVVALSAPVADSADDGVGVVALSVPVADSTDDGADVVAVSAPVAKASAAVEVSPFMALLEALRSSWARFWSNTAPTMPSRRVEVELSEATGVSGPISFGAEDVDGDTLSYSVAAKGTETGPQYGTVTIDQASGTFIYNPDDALTGETITDVFTVTVVDEGFHLRGLLASLNPFVDRGTTATMTIVVGAINEAPKAAEDNFSGIQNSPVIGNVLSNDTDREGQTLTATLVTTPEFGELDFNSDGSFTYTANADFTGTDGFAYTASDGTNTSLLADVTISMAVIPTVDTPTIGVQGLSWWLGLSDTDTDRALDMAKSVGVESLRIDISWYVVEYEEGEPDWSLIDPLVDMAIARDISVLGMLYDSPGWLSGSTDPHTPPSDPQLFAEFVAATATHYLGRIDTWEIWNEQNIPRFWATPDPVAYAELLQAVYPAIKAVDPSATVITGGLSPDPSGIDPLAYVEAMYAAGAGGYFDALSMHPYSFPYLPTLDSVKAVHDVMTANGDGDKKVWLTEVGAPTGTSPWAVSEEDQAETIKIFIDAARTTDYVGPVYLYSLLDTGTSLSDPEDNFGLLRGDFTPKPAFGVWL
ncbi:MAG: cadherin-like domain-containing protein [Actinomycetia bacterium]|nr:cadherin-like domain-containing protein [Actinomycetes bacterium]